MVQISAGFKTGSEGSRMVCTAKAQQELRPPGKNYALSYAAFYGFMNCSWSSDRLRAST